MGRNPVERPDLRCIPVAIAHSGGKRRVGHCLAERVSGGVLDHLLGVGDSELSLHLEMVGKVVGPQRGSSQPGEGWHVGLGNDLAWIDQVSDMPEVRVLLPDPCEVGAGPL